MNKKAQRINCFSAREIDIVDYLLKMGHHPVKITGYDFWYLSPLRNERTASFKVNRKINRWYDHGIGKGGNLIDFALLFHNCKLADWLESITGNYIIHHPIIQNHLSNSRPKEKSIEIVKVLPLTSCSLKNYLGQRGIILSTARFYCAEVHYKFREKIYKGIGFKNDLNGFEIRNPFYKNSSSPKGITTLNNWARKVAVFEGFFDFLSFVCLLQKEQIESFSFCVLNSLSFFESARPFLEQHSAVQLFLDNDNAGRNCVKHALKIHPKYIDGSNLYKGFKDLNEWWIKKNLPP